MRLLPLAAAVATAWLLQLATPQDFENLFDRIKRGAVINDVFDIKKALLEQKDPDPECPPCFNCNLPNFECTQFSQCNTFTGMCECRDGYGGLDCSQPLCGSLSNGNSKRPIRKDNETCKCSPGWLGINCNLCSEDNVCDGFMPEGVPGTCYQGGILVKKSHQMCDVTNPKIISILNGKKPQATFSCNRTAAACDFQFWIDEEESFYCDLNKCQFEFDLKSNSTHYNCEEMLCKCLPDKMLCGEAGLIDISEFLTETIRGPGDFSCNVAERKCRFSEPSMNDLILSVFGDPYITLQCALGECIHKSEIPGYDLPDHNTFTWGNLVTLLGVTLFVFLIILLTIYNVSKSALFKKTADLDPLTGELSELNEHFSPATLAFNNISYTVNTNQTVLRGASGIVKPGECLAIMGGSGAGKTTLLDILAGKNKSGHIGGEIIVNGQRLLEKQYKKIVGFVDQEDHLIPTLTVYETVLNSALLRLPRTMSLRAKVTRVIEVLSELRILGIKDRVIGSDFKRGISGGEKRRVLIACELVTSPLILFLDEPTSGLDSYNARNVVELLVKLSRDFNRTIVFTIHQPRSNIVSLFDKLVLLSEGDLVYSGDMIKCNDFFRKNGYQCPLGYNIADYLIDVTVEKRVVEVEGQEDIHAAFTDLEGDDTTREWEHYAVHRNEFDDSSKVVVKHNLSKIFVESVLFAELQQEIAETSANPTPVINQNYKKALVATQIAVLSSRTFKNLYRNPKLLLTSYVLSLVVGGFCGYLYYDISNDISGFQNRLGLFFFVLALFGFSALTGLHSFSGERIIFIRERANNYYHPFSYYVTKILCDVLPLRVLPPIILVSILYPLVGLTMDHNGFLKTILVLVLFNVAVATEVLIVGIVIREPGTSTMIGVLVLLFSLLFAGLFINSNDLSAQIKWLQWISLFHYAYEALAINEVKDLMLREKKFGLSIEVPGAVILSTFGFDVAAFSRDVFYLVGWIVTFLVVGYVFLHTFTYEKR